MRPLGEAPIEPPSGHRGLVDCSTIADGDLPDPTYSDLTELADAVTLDARECAHDSGVEEAHLTVDGGIVGGVHDEAHVVSDCCAEMLEQPKYAAFSDDSPQMARTTYDGFVAIHQCMVREGLSDVFRRSNVQ